MISKLLKIAKFSKIYAIAMLTPVNNSGVNGVMRFIQEGKKTTIVGEFTGLEKGKHGMHIHAFGNLLSGGT